MFKNKLTYAYLFLVGFPVFGLMTVLTAGSKLTVPKALNGSWNMKVDATPLPQSPCAAWLSVPDAALSFVVAQSGPNFTAAFSDPARTVLTGRIAADDVTLGAAASASTGCESSNPFRITARLSGPVGRRSLEGLLYANWCATCAPVPFRAQQAGAGRKER